MTYHLEFDPVAEDHLQAHVKAGNTILVGKIYKLFDELKRSPREGIGKPHRLKHFGSKEVWSRRIDSRHRMLYTVHEDVVTVFVISLWGHYGDR